MHCVQKASRLLFPGGWKRLVVLLRWSIEVPETCIFIIEYELNFNPGLINYNNPMVYRSGMYYSTCEYFGWSLTTLGANIPRTNQGVWIWRWHHFMCTAGCKGPSFTGGTPPHVVDKSGKAAQWTIQSKENTPTSPNFLATSPGSSTIAIEHPWDHHWTQWGIEAVPWHMEAWGMDWGYGTWGGLVLPTWDHFEDWNLNHL